MNATVKLTAFAATPAVIFGAAALAGGAVAPIHPKPAKPADGSWSVPVTLKDAGRESELSFRVTRDGRVHTGAFTQEVSR